MVRNLAWIFIGVAASLSIAAAPVPVLGTPFALDSGIRFLASNNLHGSAGGRFLAIEQTPSGPRGRFLKSSDGSNDGAQFTVPSAWDDMAYLASTDTYLVAVCGASDLDIYVVNGTTGAVAGPTTIYTRDDTLDISYSFGSAVVAALPNGWAIGFTCEAVDDSAATTYATLTAECIRLDANADITSGPDPLVMKSLTYNWDTDSHDWIYDVPHGAVLHDDASNTERFCMVFDDWADNAAGSTLYDVYAAVVDMNAMAVVRSWNPESVTIASTSTSLAALDTPDVAANDTDDEFMLTWNRTGTAGYSNLKAVRSSANTGLNVGIAFYVRGSLSQTLYDYYVGDIVYCATTNQFFMTWTRDGVDTYAATIAGGTSTVSSDIAIATTSAFETPHASVIDAGDTHVLIQIEVDGASSVGVIYEMQYVPPPPTITTATLPDATAGTAYSQPLSYSGGSGAPTWGISSGTLPAGLTLDPVTGIISGTPTLVGGSTFTVHLSATGSDSQSLSILVLAPPASAETSGGGGGGGGGGCASGSNRGEIFPVLFGLLILLLRRK